MSTTSQFAATKMGKLALPANSAGWEGSGTLCLKTPSTGAASGSHQLSRGFKSLQTALGSPRKKLSWCSAATLFLGRKLQMLGLGTAGWLAQ